MNNLIRWLSLGLVITLGFLLGILGFFLWDKIPTPLERINWSQEAQWISTPQPSYRIYARNSFELPDTVQSGWLKLSADNNFVLYINGQQITREIGIGSSSLGLARRLSVPFQNINDIQEYKVATSNLDLAYPNNWKLTVYVDLTKYLLPGKNTIAIEVQKARQNPRMVVEGVVYPVAAGEPIKITTGAAQWKVSTLSENRQNLRWFDRDFEDQGWSEPKVIGPVKEVTYSRLSEHLFDLPLQGYWITGDKSLEGEVLLRGNWEVPQKRKRAFIRFAGDGQYALLINDSLVKRFTNTKNNELQMYEVTNFLKTGRNTLAVRLGRPLSPESQVLEFFLDGWVETEGNSIVAGIYTDNTWTNWKGETNGKPAIIVRSLNPQDFDRQFGGNAYLLNYPDFLWHQSLWQIAGILFALAYTWVLGRFLFGRQNTWWHSLGVGIGVMLPGILFLIGISLLKHRYAESELGLLFYQPQSNYLILLGFIGIVVLTILWSRINLPNSDLARSSNWGLWFILGLIAIFGIAFTPFPLLGKVILLLGLGITLLPLLSVQIRSNLQQRWAYISTTLPTLSERFFVILIVGVGFILRVYNLDSTPRDSDENTSLDTVIGILHTGAPEATSKVWYTRGPAYHYLLALWLRIVGYSSFNARLLSVIVGTATLVIFYIFARKITGKVWLALVLMAILAIDPWELMNSRNIRFYQNLQFFTLLAFWSFFKGFIDTRNRGYQYLFFISLICAQLTQELSIVLLPCFLIIWFYRPLSLSINWQILLCGLISIAIYLYDGVFFLIKLTPLLALSNGTSTPLEFHVLDITNYTANLFVGDSRMYTLYSFFFILGFFYFLKQRRTDIIFLFSCVIIQVIFVTLLIVPNSPRYVYYIYPIFIMLSVYSAVCILNSLGNQLETAIQNILPLRRVSLVFLSLLLMFNIEPVRVLSSYQDVLSRDNNQIFEYIRTHLRTEDVVVANLPSPAAISLGKLDYYLPSAEYLGFDVVYMHQGRLIERNAGGVAINSLDKIQQILEKSHRIWIQIDDNQPPDHPKMLEIYDYVRNLGQPVIETYGVKLRLWERDEGLFPRVPNEGKDLGVY